MALEEYKRLSCGIQATDWQGQINLDRMRKERGTRTRAKMKEYGVAVAFLTGENQRYATSIALPAWQKGPSIGSGALVFTEYPEDTIIYGMGEAMAHYRVNCSWIKPENFRNCHTIFTFAGPDAANSEAKKQARLIKQGLEEKGLSKEKVAMNAVIPPLAAALADEGLHIVPAEQMMTDARKIKTVDEINCLKMAGIICDKGWWAIYEHLKPGITESELASYAATELMKVASTPSVYVAVRSGPNLCPNFAGHSPTDRIIQAGDVLGCDLGGPFFNGYHACYYRTFKVGTKPTAEEKDWYKKAHDWLYESMEIIRPGITTADVARVWPTCDEWGCKDEWERMITQIGHGIGLSLQEYPHIHRNESLEFPLPIEAGNVITLETHCGRDFVGGGRIENAVVVTEKGCENIYRWPDDEIIVPGHSLIVG